MDTKKGGRDAVYAIVTERILAALERGIVPWHKPWVGLNRPHNLVSKKPYRGINLLLLGMTEFTSPYWLSYKQAESLGGQVRKGEHGTLIVWYGRWTPPKKAGDTDEPKPVWVLRYSRVFNVEQVDGIEDKVPTVDLPGTSLTDASDRAASILEGMPHPPAIKCVGTRACYSPSTDTVKVPPIDAFESEAAFYCTMFHEIAHSTGHASRLDRFGEDDKYVTFGDPTYAREELVAEIAAAFLLTESGLATDYEYDNSAAYLGHWREVLTDDPRAIVVAAGRAQKAADYVLGTAPVETEAEEKERVTACS